ncbi:ribonuclease P/MRP protein subunit POP1, partial [Lecanoromycetidae sp. Uapishka_2]
MSLQANFSLSTLLAAGACFQSILFTILPTRVALLPPLVLLLARFTSNLLIAKGYIANRYLPSASLMRKTTALILNEDGSFPEKEADKGVVVFVVGASFNHPFGVFAPGVKELGSRFRAMFLGKTDTMSHSTPGGGRSTVTISYWKSREHLHAFAQGPVHRDGWNWFNHIHKEYPHIGIFHETFDVPAGGWENIYNSIWPIGMGNIKYHVRDKESGENSRDAKRVKLSQARMILAQTSEKALNKNGDLDVSAFVKAREFEIKAMGAGMGSSKMSSSRVAFQQVPKDLRRRTASHNVKRVPKRLRAKAARQMRDDNTPTVTSRRRKPTPHQRLRLDKAKELKQLGALTKKKREEKKQKPGETDPEKMIMLGPRLPKLKKDTLSKPSQAPAKFRKRQIHKSWLPTHLYHAKRAHMTPPKEPLWRFAIPLTPTSKCYRPTHRAATARGCVAWDMSYTSTIGVEGVEASLLGLLRSVGVEEKMLVGKREGKWRRGLRSWEGWMRERDPEKRWIAKITIVWCPDDAAMEEGLVDGQDKAAVPTGDKSQEETEGKTNEGDEENVATTNRETTSNRIVRQGKKRPKRKLLLRVHPSAFLQVWHEVLKVAKIQRPPAMVEDLRFEIGSIEVVGPDSTEALVGALHPIEDVKLSLPNDAHIDAGSDWKDMETPEKVWPQLAAVTNPASLPAYALLGFNITDPRLRYPPRTIQKPLSSENSLLELLSSWPPDQTQASPDIFDRTKRLMASRSLASQKAINRRKGDSKPGAYPSMSPKDPKIPILSMASRTSTTAGQGSWTFLFPWDCVLPVWYSLMHYPLSSGGNPRFGGLQEKRQVFFEQGVPWFPGDYPGTKAGFQWEMLERERKKQEWEKRPRGKRTEWASVDLGDGKKGEIGMGWACDWERLFQGPPAPASQKIDDSTTSVKEPDREAKSNTSAKAKSQSPSLSKPQPEQPPIEPPHPPLNIRHLVNPLTITIPIPPTALAPVHLTLLTTGHPTSAARIYRLPTTNDDLRNKWLALASPQKPGKKVRPQHPIPPPANAPEHLRNQYLARTLLNPSNPALPASALNAESPKAGDPAYPCVPDEVDLIGFVTTGNYHLGEGKCEAIGNVAVARVMNEEVKKWKSSERSLCIVREAGQSLGRLARWKFV